MPRTTINSTIKGKAYEYASVLALVDLVTPFRPVEIEENSSLSIARGRFLNDISKYEREDMVSSAKAGVAAIIKMEPRIIEDGEDTLTVTLQPDNVARNGDVRDLLVIRRSLDWEIGISVKHNHEALKHSRLSSDLDFGESWYGIKSSNDYFNEIAPVFRMLKELKEQGALWSTIPNKEDSVYVPLLNAFIKEVLLAYKINGDKVTTGLIKYLLGSNGKDYYKMIHRTNHTTTVIPYNIYGTLNSSSSTKPAEIKIQLVELPTRIIELKFKDNSLTTVELVMDKGWSISFRIHNASSRVEPSLKFDIQLMGHPAKMFYLNVSW